jgi:hypothetical protein
MAQRVSRREACDTVVAYRHYRQSTSSPRHQYRLKKGFKLNKDFKLVRGECEQGGEGLFMLIEGGAFLYAEDPVAELWHTGDPDEDCEDTYATEIYRTPKAAAKAAKAGKEAKAGKCRKGSTSSSRYEVWVGVRQFQVAGRLGVQRVPELRQQQQQQHQQHQKHHPHQQQQQFHRKKA